MQGQFQLSLLFNNNQRLTTMSDKQARTFNNVKGLREGSVLTMQQLYNGRFYAISYGKECDKTELKFNKKLDLYCDPNTTPNAFNKKYKYYTSSQDHADSDGSLTEVSASNGEIRDDDEHKFKHLAQYRVTPQNSNMLAIPTSKSNKKRAFMIGIWFAEPMMCHCIGTWMFSKTDDGTWNRIKYDKVREYAKSKNLIYNSAVLEKVPIELKIDGKKLLDITWKLGARHDGDFKFYWPVGTELLKARLEKLCRAVKGVNAP